MIIDLKEVKEVEYPSFKGGKGSVFLKILSKNDVKFLQGRVPVGASVGLHRHMTDSETILVLSGKGKAICDGETEIVGAGSCSFCPRGSAHTLINDGVEDLIFYAVVPEQCL